MLSAKNRKEFYRASAHFLIALKSFQERVFCIFTGLDAFHSYF